MRNKLIVVGLFFSLESFSQAAIVSAPVLENIATATSVSIERQGGIMATMSNVVQSLEKAEHEFKEAMKKATWMRNLQSARRLLFMVENLVCTSKDITVNLGYVDSHSSCLVNYKFDISIAKIQLSADYLGILLTDGIAMTPAERMQVMSLTQSKFEEANDEFLKIQRQLEADKIRRQIDAAIYSDVRKMIRIKQN